MTSFPRFFKRSSSSLTSFELKSSLKVVHFLILKTNGLVKERSRVYIHSIGTRCLVHLYYEEVFYPNSPLPSTLNLNSVPDCVHLTTRPTKLLSCINHTKSRTPLNLLYLILPIKYIVPGSTLLCQTSPHRPLELFVLVK